MNKAETILNWTSAMNAVHMLLVEVIAEQNLWVRSMRTQNRSSLTMYTGANARNSRLLNVQRSRKQDADRNDKPTMVTRNIVEPRPNKPSTRKRGRRDIMLDLKRGRVKVD